MTVGTGTGSITTPTIVPRPTLYDSENQRRSEHFAVRTAMLNDDFAEEMLQWMLQAFGQEQVDAWGPADTTLNPLASQTRQLTTPGLYGRTPKVTGPPASEPLLGPDGYLAEACVWSRAQWLQYMTVGIGIYFRRLGVTWELNPDGSKRDIRLTDMLVNPRDVVAFVDEYNTVVALWHLRLREKTVEDSNGVRVERFWLWDQWDIRPGRPPSLRVVEAGISGQPGKDVSREWLELPDGTRGALVGDNYPWKRPSDNAPYLPWVVYRAIDGGDFWPSWRRAMHSLTLRSGAYWTFVARCALFSTGEHVIIGGADIDSVPGAQIKRGDGNLDQAATPQLTMRVNPGTMTFISPKGTGQLTVNSLGPGSNLPQLVDFANLYQMLGAIGDGLNPSDATRTAANPTSGAALAISAASKREFSVQVRPLFADSDLEMLTKCAWLLRLADVTVPDAGYSIEYHTISLSPSEQADERAQLEWEESHGQLSPIDLHVRLHPGKTPEQALEAIVAARADAIEIKQLVDEELERRGVVKPPPLFPAGNTGPDDEAKPESEPDDAEAEPVPDDGEEE